MKRWGYSLLLCLVLGLSLPALVSAHANLEKSVPLQNAELPTSPDEIRIKFTEHIDTTLSQVTLEDEKGNRIEGKLNSEDNIWLLYHIPKLDDGIYIVRWQVLSVDSHVTEGSFLFAVGVSLVTTKPSETISLDDPVADKPVTEATDSKSTIASIGNEKSEQDVKLEELEKLEELPTKVTVTTINPNHDDISVPSPFSNEISSTHAGHELDSLPEIPEATALEDNPRESESDSELATELIPSNQHDHTQPNTYEQARDWRSDVSRILRIAEIFAAAVLSGFIFFRYMVWGIRRSDAPPLFSLRNETIVASVVVTTFVITGILHVWMLADQFSASGSYSVWDRLDTILSSTWLGKAAWLRPIAAGLILVSTLDFRRNQQFTSWVKLIGALGLVITFPLTGHAYASSTGIWLAVFSHTLHMITGAVWFVGLIGLLMVTKHRKGQLITLTLLNGMIRRFSMLALPLLILIVISGVYLAFIRLNSWSSLVQDDYGILILIKSGMVLLILVIAALHRYVFMPRIFHAIQQGHSTEPKAMLSLEFLVRLEIGIAVFIMILADTLSTTTPPDKVRSLEPMYLHVMGDGAPESSRPGRIRVSSMKDYMK